MADKSQQTEKPTQRRFQKAREEGNFVTSRELLAAFQFLTFVALVSAGAGNWLLDVKRLTRMLLSRAVGGDLTATELIALSRELLLRPFAPLIVGGLILLLAVLVIQLAITGFGLSAKKLSPDVSRLNPLNRLKQVPRQNLFSAFQAAVMLPLFLYAAYVISRDNLEAYFNLSLTTVDAAVGSLAVTLRSLLWKAGAVFLVFGVIEFARERRRYINDLKMSKQEIREELKESEGNPNIKSRIRRLQREFGRRRMLQKVPQATAVIVNPTHYAVALRYDMEAMAAPVVLAKGLDHLALKIRALAVEHNVPIVENPPLAHALYQSVDVGQEIPVHLYRAVAEILAYIHRLNKGRAWARR